MASNRPSANPETGEPLRRGATVEDAEGHLWKRGNTLWTCQAPVGTRYFSKTKRRMLTVESVGRLPWHALKQSYGPLVVIDLNDRS